MDGVQFFAVGLLIALTCSSPAAQDQAPCTLLETQQLNPSDAAAGARFGWLAMDADQCLIGANGSSTTLGKAYVYERLLDTWQEQATLLAPDGLPGDSYGQTLALSGDVAVVGAQSHATVGQNAGAAYVFRRVAGQWGFEQKLVPSDAQANQAFGAPALEGDWVALGAPGDDERGRDAGAVYLFRDSGTQWLQVQKLFASNAASGDFFGTSVAISGDALLVGAANGDGGAQNSGTAYVFRRQGLVWTEEQLLVPSDSAFGDRFSSVALDGDLALVGAESKDDTGAAYLFRRLATGWTEEQKLTPSDGRDRDLFGRRVSIDAELAVVGASLHDQPASNAGAAYVYRDTGAGWVHAAKLSAQFIGAQDTFGNTSAVADGQVIIGAGADDDFGDGSGSAFAYSMPDLTLSSPRPSLDVGQRLTLTVCGGLPGGPVLWLSNAPDGTSTNTLGSAVFDDLGSATFTATVPSPAAGHTFSFTAFGAFRVGQMGSSNAVSLQVR